MKCSEVIVYNFICFMYNVTGRGEICMYIEELIPEINLETKNIEFKGIIEEGPSESGRSKEIGWLKTLAAFANTDGGNLYIGVENKTHKILSLDHETADKIGLMIHRQIQNRIEPSIDYDIIPIPCKDEVPTRYVLRVAVRMNKNLPVTVHEEGLLGIYIRSFGQTVLATPEQIRDLILMSDNTPYDQSFTDILFQREHFRKLFQYVEDQGETLTEKSLISIGFMSADLRLSKGALLFEDQCRDLRTKAVATAWPGISKGSSVVIASEEFTGNLLEIIESCILFVKNRSNNGFQKEETGRKDYIAYPLRSVTEGIVNAVGHRNYYIQGSQIEVNVFRDRLEITSPGSLLGVKELKKEKNIAQIIPRRRNDVICAVLELCHYMEEKGSGFDKIEADYSGYGEEYQPYISADASSFTLTLPDLTFKGGVLEVSEVLPPIYTDGILIGKNDIHILSYCFGKARTAKEIAAEIGIQPSTYFRKTVLGKLVNQGLLLEQKNGKSIKYKANPENVHLKT